MIKTNIKIDISGILNSKNADNSYGALRKSELFCERATEFTDKYFETGKAEDLNNAVINFTSAANLNFKYSRIYVSLSQVCLRLELLEEAKALLSRLLEFDPGNLIAGNMLKIVNSKIAANKKREKPAHNTDENLAKKFSKFFSSNKHSSNIKVKVSESTFSKLGKIFYRE